MAFDEAKFRASAKAAGYSDADIDAELKGSPTGSAPAPSMDDQFAERERKLREEYDKKVKQATTSEVTVGDRTFEIPSFFTSTAGLVTGTGAVIGAGTALYGASKVAPAVYQAVKNRWINKVPEIDRTIDIPMDATPVAPVATQATTELAKPAAPAVPDRLQRAAEIIEANRQAGIGGQPMAPVAPVEAAPMAPVAPVTPTAPVAPVEAPISTPLSSAPVDAPAPTPSAKPGSVVTEVVVDEIKNLMQDADKPVAPPGELRTGTGKVAFPGTGPEAPISKRTGQPQFKPEYASMADVPKGYAVVPDAQYIDALRQDLGQLEYTKAFTGRDFPTDYEKAIATGKDINRSLGRATREEAKAAGLPYGEITPGIAQKTTSGKKLVTVGGKAGIAGALVSLADLAKAETAAQRGMAGANLLEAVLPPSMMIGGAGEGSSAVPSVDAAMLLGSPYAQTEIAKKRRQQEEYTRKVGAGRGIAPPSAYMR